jgi:hypothetical protein
VNKNRYRAAAVVTAVVVPIVVATKVTDASNVVAGVAFGALPALILVLFAGLLGLLALACEEKRRDYALAYAEKFVKLAAVIVGSTAGTRERTQSR